MPRRARPTIRCLRDDLQIALPARDVVLDELDDPILSKARDLAPAYPLNQERLELVTDRRAYKFPHGRHRVADWLEESVDIVWVIGTGLREEGSAADVYEHLTRVYEAGNLWPDEDDYRRDALEGAVRFLRMLRRDAKSAITVAVAHRGEEVEVTIAERIQVIMFVDQGNGLEEIWLGVLTPDVRGAYLTDETKQMVFAAFKEAARDAEWDEPGRWVNRPLEWYEVALLGVREQRT